MALPSASTPWLVDLTAVLSDVRLCTKRTRSPISPRPGVEGRPEVVGAVQNDEIDPTWKSRIHRHGHKSRAGFTVDDRDRFRASGPSASMSPPNASSTSLVSILVFWPSNASSIV